MNIWEQALGPTLKLTRDELLLLDWALCASARILPEMDTESLMKWRDFRADVWLAIKEAERGGAAGTAPLALQHSDADLLFAYLPTTFRWGTGPDCGYSLKSKIARFLRGESDDAPNENEANNQTGATSGAAA